MAAICRVRLALANTMCCARVYGGIQQVAHCDNDQNTSLSVQPCVPCTASQRMEMRLDARFVLIPCGHTICRKLRHLPRQQSCLSDALDIALPKAVRWTACKKPKPRTNTWFTARLPRSLLGREWDTANSTWSTAAS